jgi:hypothetical protein
MSISPYILLIDPNDSQQINDCLTAVQIQTTEGPEWILTTYPCASLQKYTFTNVQIQISALLWSDLQITTTGRRTEPIKIKNIYSN